MFTRKQRLSGECTHQEYYNQFINEETIANVVGHIGAKNLLEANYPRLNSIPLTTWDMIRPVGVSEKMKDAGDYLTLSGAVCINKEAARIWIKRQLEKESEEMLFI